MIWRVFKLYYIELAKIHAQRITLLGPFLLGGLVLVLSQLYSFDLEGRSQYEYVADATAMTLGLPGALLILAFCARLVSSELGTGSLRGVLVRPVLRRDYLIAKLLAGFSYGLLLYIVVAAVAWGVFMYFEQGYGVVFGGELLYSNREMHIAYLTCMAASLPPMLALVSFAVMVSVMTKNSGAAVGSVTGFFIVMDFAKHPLNITPYLFTTYIDWPWQIFSDMANGFDARWFPSLYYSLASSVVAISVFVIIAILLFNRRNLRP